ncbi:MAG: lysostaphin resistance A-like protein [Sphingobacteriaceae bacterium]
MLKDNRYFMIGTVLYDKNDIFMLRKYMDNLGQEEIENSKVKPVLPFNNLFLNIGVVEGGNKLWMYLFGIALTVLAYLVIGGIMIMPLLSRALKMGVTQAELVANQYIVFDPVRLGIDKNIILIIQFGLFVAAFIGLYMAVKLIHRKRFLSLITAFEKFRYKQFFFAFSLWAILLIIAVIVSYSTNSDDMVLQFNLPKFMLLFLVCIVFLPIQTLTEEVFFRGYLLQGLSQIFKNGVVPLIITSFLFGTAHMSNPETSAYGSGLMLTYYVVFALVLGAITLLNEGLELAYGIHLANNLISALTITSENSVLKTDAIFFVRSENAAAELVLAFCSLLAVFVVFWFKYRWKNFSLILK